MLLSDIEFFKGLSSVEQSRLLGSMEKLSFTEGQIIFNYGDEGDSLYIIATGKIELFVINENSSKYSIKTLEDGEAFGEMALLTGEPRSASAKAITNVLLYKMDNITFNQIISENSSVSLYLFKLLSKRLKRTNSTLHDSEFNRSQLIEKQLNNLPKSTREAIIVSAVLIECDIEFLSAYLKQDMINEIVENKNLCSNIVSIAENTLKISILKDSRLPILNIYNKEYGNEGKIKLIAYATEFYISHRRFFEAVNLNCENGCWGEVCDLIKRLDGENIQLTTEQKNKICEAMIKCPDEILFKDYSAFIYFLNISINYNAEAGLLKIERAILNADNYFKRNEKAEIYKIAALYCNKSGLNQKAIEYLNMAKNSAYFIDTSGSEEIINDLKKYEATKREYEGSFGIAMAKNARNLSVPRNSLTALIAISISIIIILLFKNVSPFEGLTRNAMMFISISLIAVLFWIVDLVPPFIVALGMAFSWVVTGLVKPEIALSGFSSPVWLYMVCIFAFGTAISKSGLLYRLSLHILKAFPKSYFGQLLGLAVSGMIFSPLIPSSTAKVSLSASIAQSISEAMGLKNKSKGSAGLGLCAMIFFGYLSSYFLTGSYINAMAWGLVPKAGKISWFQWFYNSIPPLVFFSAGIFIVILILFNPKGTEKKLSEEVLNEQIKILGKYSRGEKITAVVAVGVILMLLTQSIHGIDSTWIALIGVVVLVTGGALDTESFKEGIDWPFLLFIGISFSFINVLSQFGIVNAMTKVLSFGMRPFMISPYIFLTVVAVVGYSVTFLIRDEPAVMLLVVSMISLTHKAGVGAWPLIFVILVSTDPFFFPYQSATYLTAYYSSGEKSFSHKQGQKMALSYAAVSILSIILSIPFWRIMGLISK